MSDDPIAAAARAAATKLADRYGSSLAEEVESALYARGTGNRPDQYIDPISLGSLIVSTASLAWTIYLGLKNKTSSPSPNVLARAVRIELRIRGDESVASQDEVTEIVITEIIQAADDSG